MGWAAIHTFAAVALGSGLSGASAQTDQTAKPATEICIIIPHFKDEYWLSVGYGMRLEADALNAKLLIYESGGYHSLDRQISLLENCTARKVDVILIGAVSADDPRLLSAVDSAATQVPVLALVNALNASDLSGWIGVDWTDMGFEVGQFLTQRHPEGSATKRVVLISGPGVSGWGPLVEGGLNAGLDKSAVEIVATYRADTGLREQLREVESALADYPEIDYLIGSAPAIEGAMALLRRRHPDHAPKLIALYISHSVLRGLKSGQIEAVPFDDPIEQGRLGIELAVKAAKGGTIPGLTGPEIRLIETGTAQLADIYLSPAGFVPDPE